MRVVRCVSLVVLLSACSGINLTRWRSSSYDPAATRRVAVLPLLVAGAAQEHKVTNISFGWMSEYSWTTQLSPAQYQPAAATMEAGIQRALSGLTAVMPAEVNAAMKDARVADVPEAVVAVAKTLEVDAVLVFELRDFKSRPAGLEEARAWARADLVLYSRQAEPLWTLSADVSRGPAGSPAAPSLAQLMEYALGQLEPEIRAMLAR